MSSDLCYSVEKTDLIVLAEHLRTGLIVVSDYYFVVNSRKCLAGSPGLNFAVVD